MHLFFIVLVGLIPFLLGGCVSMKPDTAPTRSTETGSVSTSQPQQHSSYLSYSASGVTESLIAGKIVVLFFHADRCPSCRAFEKNLFENTGLLDESLVIYKVNYDTQRNLIKQYEIRSQHTFVLLDQQQNSIKTFTAFTLEDLLNNIQ